MLVLFGEAVIGIVCSGITDENLHGDCDFADDNSFSGDDIWTDTNFCVSLVDDKLSTGGGGGDNDGVHVFKDGSLVDDEWPVLVDGSLSDGDGLIFNLGLFSNRGWAVVISVFEDLNWRDSSLLISGRCSCLAEFASK